MSTPSSSAGLSALRGANVRGDFDVAISGEATGGFEALCEKKAAPAKPVARAKHTVTATERKRLDFRAFAFDLSRRLYSVRTFFTRMIYMLGVALQADSRQISKLA